MERWLRHLHGREWRFLALSLATLACMAGFLSSGFEALHETPGGWRRVDLGRLNERIDRGDLMTREALWYHPAEASGSGRSATDDYNGAGGKALPEAGTEERETGRASVK